MENNIQLKTRQLNKEYKKKRRWQKVVTSLAAVVVFCTTYALILPAITWERQLICTVPVHTHSEGCYEEIVIPAKQELICTAAEHVHTEECFDGDVLICTAPEHTHDSSCYAPHEHTADCYALDGTLLCQRGEHTEKHLICELEEHEHTDACFDAPPAHEEGYYCGQVSHTHSAEQNCYFPDGTLKCTMKEHVHTLACESNKNADLESVSSWMSTFANVELTGSWSKDALEIAKTQIGYCESTRNFEVVNETVKYGYTRYGAWYGDPYGDWCAMFCSFCLDYADVDRSLMPLESSCPRWVNTLSNAGLFRSADTYIPRPGDLVFFDWNTSCDENGEVGVADHVGFVYEVLCDESGNPQRIRTIEGNYGDTVTAENIYPLGSAVILGYCELPENAEYAAQRVKTLTAETEDGITVTLTAMPESLPYPAEEISLSVTPIENPEVNELMTSSLAEDGLQIEENLLFDIKLLWNGEEIEPIGPVTVSFSGVSADDEDGELQVYYVDEEAKHVENMDAALADNGTLVMETDHFTIYTVTRVSPTPGRSLSLMGSSAPTGINQNGTTVTSTDITVVKQWASGSTPTPVQVQLYKNGTADGAKVTLNASNNWTYTWTGKQLKFGSTTYTYTVQEDTPSGYTASYETSNVTQPAYFVPCNNNLSTSGPFAIISSDGMHLANLSSPASSSFTPLGSVDVSAGSGTVSLGGTNYTDWYSADSIPSTARFAVDSLYSYNLYTEMPVLRSSAYSGSYLSGNGYSGSSLLGTYNDSYSATIVNYSSDYLYSSFDFADRINDIYFSYGCIVYDSSNQTFRIEQYPGSYQPVKVYRLVTSSVGTATVTITNTPTTAPTQSDEISCNGTNVNYTDITVVKQWATGSTPTPVQVQLYKNGSADGSKVTLNASNNWRYTWKNKTLKSGSTEYTYTVQEDTPSGYVASYETTNVTQPTSAQYFVPIEANGIDSYQENHCYAFISAGSNNALSNEYAYIYAVPVSPGTGTIASAYGLHTDNWYPVNEIPESARFVCDLYGSGFPVMENSGTYLSTNYYYVIIDSNIDYASVFSGIDGYPTISASPSYNYPYELDDDYLVYDYSFCHTYSPSYQEPVLLYELVTAAPVGSATVTITNTPASQVQYDLNILKVSGANNSTVLSGAKFELRSGSSPLHFTRNSSTGIYTYTTSTSAITELITGNDGYIHVKGLPGGQYTLVETLAPSGYTKADNTTVTLNESTTDRTLDITVEDPVGSSYALPSTGGMGANTFYALGALLIAGALMYGCIPRRKRERRAG